MNTLPETTFVHTFLIFVYKTALLIQYTVLCKRDTVAVLPI